MLTKIHRMSSKEKEMNKSNEEWLSISKSLTCRINHLEREKESIVEETMREKKKWGDKYG